MDRKYIFKSERLGFRNWIESDLSKMAAINSDPEVMKFFPNTADFKKTKNFIERMKKQFHDKGFCYFAVDKLLNNEFIGFIGLAEQTFESEFTPCVDMGWRISRKEWNTGFATEGAKRCLEFAFDDIGLKNIKATCPVINDKSQQVMIKIGMKQIRTFNHPLLKDHKALEPCFLYEIERCYVGHGMAAFIT
jgi:RimJ/RimL family protein N-acetyltransferase